MPALDQPNRRHRSQPIPCESTIPLSSRRSAVMAHRTRLARDKYGQSGHLKPLWPVEPVPSLRSDWHEDLFSRAHLGQRNPARKTAREPIGVAMSSLPQMLLQSIHSKHACVGIIGIGYVGWRAPLPRGGYRVLGLDIDPAKVWQGTLFVLISTGAMCHLLWQHRHLLLHSHSSLPVGPPDRLG